jgi:hypothetical protein
VARLRQPIAGSGQRLISGEDGVVKERLLGLIACVALVGASSPAGATVYDLTGTSSIGVSGTITTDGTIGTLSAADITDWLINQPVTRLAPGTIDPANSTVTLTGGALTATSTELRFSFSDTAPSLLSFASNNFFGGSGGVNFQYCGADPTTPCFTSIGNRSSSITLALVAPGTGSTQASVPESGVSEIASAAATPGVPQLSTWAMMLLGFAGLGFVGYRRATRARAAFAD